MGLETADKAREHLAAATELIRKASKVPARDLGSVECRVHAGPGDEPGGSESGADAGWQHEETRDERTALVDEALAHIRKGITLDPTVPGLFLTAASAYEMLRDYSSAIAHLRHCIRTIGPEHETRHRLASMLMVRTAAILLAKRRRGEGLLGEADSWDMSSMGSRDSADGSLGGGSCGSSSVAARSAVAGVAPMDFTLQEAVDNLEEASRLNPLDVQVWTQLAVVQVQIGGGKELAGALEAIRQLVSLVPRNGEAYILRAKIHYHLKNSDQGDKDMATAVELAPTHPEVVLFQRKMFRRSNALYTSAKDELGAGRAVEAVALLSQGLVATPGDMRLLILRAVAQRKASRYPEALADLEEAATIFFKARTNYHPPVSLKMNDRDREFDLRQAMQNAAPWDREPLQVTKQRNLVYNDMAIDLMLSNKHEQAIVVLNQAIRDEERLAAHPHQPAAVSSTAGSGATAIPRAETNPVPAGEKASPGLRVNARFYVNRGDCYQAIGRVEEALADFHRANDSDPANWEVRTRLSMIHYMIGVDLFNHSRFSESAIELSFAIDWNSKVAQYYAIRGRAHYYQHQFDQAHTDFREALRLDPTLEDVKARLMQFEPHQDSVRELEPQAVPPPPPRQNQIRLAAKRRPLRRPKNPLLPSIDLKQAAEAQSNALQKSMQLQSLRVPQQRPKLAREPTLWSVMKSSVYGSSADAPSSTSKRDATRRGSRPIRAVAGSNPATLVPSSAADALRDARAPVASQQQNFATSRDGFVAQKAQGAANLATLKASTARHSTATARTPLW